MHGFFFLFLYWAIISVLQNGLVFSFSFINRFGLNQEEHTTEPNTQKSHFFLISFPFFFCYSLRFWRFFALIYGNDCSHTVYILYPNGVPQKFHFFCTILLVCAFFRFFYSMRIPNRYFGASDVIQIFPFSSKSKKNKKKFLFFLLFFFLYFILFFEQNKQISPNENLFFCSCLGKESFLFNVFGVLDVAGCCVRLMRLRVSPLKFCLSRVFLTILRVGLRENVSSMGTSGARKIHQLQHKVSLNCHFSITHQKNTQMNVEIFPLSLFFLFLFFFFFAH